MRCPACGLGSPVRLLPGQRCASCASAAAWSDAARAGALIIDHAAIAEAVQQRRGRSRSAWRRIPVATAITCAGAALALWQLTVSRAPRPIGPLAELLDELQRSSGRAALAGLLTVGVGVTASLVARRGRGRATSWPILALHLLAVIAGALVALGAGVPWLLARAAPRHVVMQPLAPSGVASRDRIVAATAVVLAPDGDGDARHLAMGAGAVIARDASRAWIVTCSHVAMPYAAVGARKRAADAHPVWVQLADGRQGRGRVRWTAAPPLDLALVELPIEHAPEPVPIAADTAALQRGAAVIFAANPYRAGWLVHRGQILRRDEHRTPAGSYQLLHTDLPLLPGDSGTGLYDERGRLVGLNTWARASGDTSHGVSLPAEAMHALAEALATGPLDPRDPLDPLVPLPPVPPRR
jgi:S1-C subfamily serine protease